MKGKNLFFIGMMVLTYLVSGVLIAESFLEKELKLQAKEEWDSKVAAESFWEKFQMQSDGKKVNYENEMIEEDGEAGEEKKDVATEKEENGLGDTKTHKEAEELVAGKEETQKPATGNSKDSHTGTEEMAGNTEREGSDDTISVNSWNPEPVGKEYFADALFIGDSRTVGLKEYGDMKGAVFFAESGMSVFDLWKKKLPAFSEGKESFEEVLNKRKYGKIYLMLGINELGYEFENIQKKYLETLEKIREKQKEAVIYLCANLHITEEHSRKDEIYNNENVNLVNEMIRTIADNDTTFYLDVNKIFDDETGSLSTEYASDSFHVYGKYYIKWVDWLCTQTVHNGNDKNV